MAGNTRLAFVRLSREETLDGELNNVEPRTMYRVGARLLASLYLEGIKICILKAVSLADCQSRDARVL